MELRHVPVLPLTGYRNNGCSTCGAAPRTVIVDGRERPEGFLDIGVWIEQEGGFAICETCAKHIARFVGFLSPDDVEGLTAELAEVLDTVQVLLAREREQADLIESYQRVLRQEAPDLSAGEQAMAAIGAQ